MVRISRSDVAFVAQAVLHAHRHRHDLACDKWEFLILECEDAFACKPVNRLDFVGVDVDADDAAGREAQEPNADELVVCAFDQGFEIDRWVAGMWFPGDVVVVGDGDWGLCMRVIILVDWFVTCVDFVKHDA